MEALLQKASKKPPKRTSVQFFRQAKNSPVTNRPLFYAKCPILLYKQKTFKKYNETSILSQFLTLNSNLLSVFNS